MTYSDSQIYSYRKTVISYLKNKNLKKGKHKLIRTRVDPNTNTVKATNQRCCLGHMCIALGLKHVSGTFENGVDAILPSSAMDMLGMHTLNGGAKNGSLDKSLMPDRMLKKIINVDIQKHYAGNTASLATYNDFSTIQPWEIAEYLENVILGGDGTPWREIKV